MLWHTLLACWRFCVCMQGVCCATLREALACSVGSRDLCYVCCVRVVDRVTYMYMDNARDGETVQ